MKNLNGKNVFVTGACGFIGSHLCECLVESGANVTALVYYNSFGNLGNLEKLPRNILNEINIQFGNVEDRDRIRTLTVKQDAILHLAALIGIPYSYVAPESYIKTNIMGTLNILEAGRLNNVSRIVHTSTSETYGSAQYCPIDEQHPLQGQSPYSASKIGADKLVESFYRSFNTPVVTLRPFNTYGPRQSTRAIIPTVISQLLNKSPSIKLGSLSPVRDLTFVRDTARAYLNILTSSDQILGETINIGAGKSISVGKLAELLMEILDIKKPIETESERVRPDKSEVIKLECDNRKAAQLIHWHPKYELHEGLRETVRYFSMQPPCGDTERYGI